MAMRLRAMLSMILTGCAHSACTGPVSAQEVEPPPRLAREFRAAWVATVNNIDWPSRRGLPTRQARAELDAIVHRAAELHLNALVFQVRPAADAMYRSPFEPWSEWLTGTQGKAPDEDWDPLEYLIDRCHENGIELHAWFNPFRAAHPTGGSKPAPRHVRRRLPEACLPYGNYVWMDPGDPRAADWTMRVILDVVRRYDIDGVHIDDYFYPYPLKGKVFPDDRSFGRYRARGGRLDRDAWRRANIDDFVERLYDDVHAEKPWVQVGISPFGIARPGVPRGIQAGIDQYADLYADVRKWMRRGWYDYMAPQLYWPTDQRPQSFAVLLPWWLRENARGRHVWPGINPGRALARKKNWRRDELSEQIERIRDAEAHPGHIHFSFKALQTDAPHVGAALRRLYAEPAAVPPSPWLGSTAPPAPHARLTRKGPSDRLRWDRNPAFRFVAVQARDTEGWRTLRIVGARRGSLELLPGWQAIAVRAIGRTGIESAPTLLERKTRRR